MSDNSRQSFTDKASSALKPDQQKSTTEQAGDSIKGMADSAASAVQPDSQKSATQKAGDATTGNNKSMMDSAKEGMGKN